jgi:glycosyltransferase involved in cell wall biosynthesis
VASEPLVSVVIPTHNNAALVVEAVESVLAQTWRNVETIVVDDGSTDGTGARLARFGSRILLIRQQHRGPAVARNAGLRAARGELIGFLDSDDLWMPEKLARCAPAFAGESEVGVVYTALRIHELDTGLEYLLPQYTMSGWMARDLFVECKGVNTSTLVVRRAALDKVGRFDEELFRAQDWDLMIRLAEQFKYAHVPEVLTERRLHRGSLSVTHRNLYAEYNLRVIRKAAMRRPDLYARLEPEAMARAHFRFGMSHYGEYEMAAARREFRRSLRRRWNWRAFNYLLRAHLPVAVVRRLRRLRAGLSDEKSHA